MTRSRRATQLLAFTFLLSALTLPASGQAQDRSPIPQDLVKQVTGAIDSDAGRLQKIFKDIHQNPELGFMEVVSGPLVRSSYHAHEHV